MAEKYQQVHQADHAQAKHDEESATTTTATATVPSDKLRRKKRMKCLLYVLIFIVFQIGVITLFSLTIMKVRNPKFRVRSLTFENTIDAPNTSFNLSLNAQLGVRNTNFGPYKYDNTTIYFYYKDTEVGSANLPKSKANFRSTKKVNVVVKLVAPANVSGILPLTSQSRLSGKVELMFIFKKRKTINMNCTMEINITTTALQNLQCN